MSVVFLNTQMQTDFLTNFTRVVSCFFIVYKTIEVEKSLIMYTFPFNLFW